MKNVFTAASPIAGIGLFSKKNFKAEEIIFSFKGDHIFHDYTPQFALEGLNWIGVGDREWVIPKPDSPVLFLNHSCKPNVFITKNLELISAGIIERDAELFLDYSTTELDPFWTMNCNCQNPDCRKLIRSFPFLPLVKQLQYRRFINRVFWDESQQTALNNKGRLYG